MYGKGFFNYYKPGDIIFPNAVARYYSESVKMAYNRCENRIGKDIRKLYMIQCPFCGREANQDRYYAIPDLPINEEIDCIHCDNIFEVSHDTTLVLYEKEKTNDRK